MADDYSRAVAAAAERAPVGSVWRHRKGGVYRVAGHALIEATLAPAVLYARADDDFTWCRPAEEFLDGRFTREDP